MMMILEIQEGAEFDSMPQLLQKAISKAGIEWPESRLPGTSPANGRQLILVNSLVSKEQLSFLMNNDEFDDKGNQIAFNLGWSVLACEDEPVDQDLLLSYFDDTPVFDNEGNQIGSEPVTDLTNKLQHWAGKRWTY